MNLSEFIKQYDFDGSIVLLEGKRKVLAQDQPKLEALGLLLASNTNKMIFRSGNATGADAFFSSGVSQVNPSRLQVIVPYENHRKKLNFAGESISLNQIDLVSEPEIVYQSKRNAKTKNLIDPFVSGEINRLTLKASYIIRDTVKVLGASNIARASFGIFYDDLSKPLTGGTGHTMDVCKHNQIPYIDQRIWLDWL